MPRSWWFKAAFVFILFTVAVLGLIPTYVELVAYPEKPQDTEDVRGEDEGSNEAEGQAPTPEEAAPIVAVEAEREPALPSWYTWFATNITDNALTLGLDLQGGLLLRYSVDVDGALDEKLDKFAEDIEVRLKEKGVEGVDAKALKDQDRIEITFDDGGSGEIDDKFMDDFPVLIEVGESGNTITLGLRENYIKETEEFSVKQAVEIIRERVDAIGVASPSVRVEGGRHIVVELPGLSSRRAAAAEKLISTTAVLRFKLVADATEEQATLAQFSQRLTEADSLILSSGGALTAVDQVNSEGRVTLLGKDVLKAFVEKHEELIPDLRDVVYQRVDQDADDKNPVTWRARLVRNDTVPTDCEGCLRELTGDNVDDAFPATDPNTNLPYVSLKLDKKGGDTFYEVTKQHVGDQLAILMDDTLVSDPVIRSEIPGGNVSIEMGGNNRRQIMDDVQNLVVALRSGALPAPIRQEFKTLVGPTLGRDSIERGTMALLVGSGLIILFMLIYYKLGGLIANIALLLNLVFIMAIMASLGAALTLPGIAGIVLTVGMAVDANVIIFERVREEIRAGETPRKSIQLGYGKAYWTILDANITTGIAALVLMEFGSGPVRGFAVTLLIGIICSVFTAVFVSRLVFDLYLTKTKADRLPI